MSVDLNAYIRFLEKLSPDTLDKISTHVAPNIRFKDPFNDVEGIKEMKTIFSHMFEEIEDVSFKVNKSFTGENNGCIEWTFSGKLREKPWIFNGTSILVFDHVGLIVEHTDYWDAAREFYEKIPFIGWVLALIRKRIAVS